MQNMTRSTATCFIAVTFCALAFLVASGLYYFVSKQGARLEARAIDLARNTAELRQYDELASLIDNTATKREELNSYFLKKSTLVPFLAEIESAARGLGITLETLSLNETSANDSSSTVQVSYALRGNYDSIMAMIELFETLPYKSQLNELAINKSSRDFSETGTASANLLLTLHTNDY